MSQMSAVCVFFLKVLPCIFGYTFLTWFCRASRNKNFYNLLWAICCPVTLFHPRMHFGVVEQASYTSSESMNSLYTKIIHPKIKYVRIYLYMSARVLTSYLPTVQSHEDKKHAKRRRYRLFHAYLT